MAPQQKDVSFPQLVYPSLRDTGIKDAHQWMAGKAMDDRAEGLWRVGNKLYDLQDFINKHPGGENWLKWTKGTDITEAFEVHHYTKTPAALLEKYYVRDAKGRRNSPFTFNEDGFYKTLKSRVIEEMKHIPKGHGTSSKRILETLVFCTFLFSVLAVRADWGFAKLAFVLLSGITMAWTGICAHNFFHQKDNWRMYMFNLTLMSSDEWRVTHVLSHHLFPNTLMDYEMSSLEPFFHYLPKKDKSFFKRYVPYVYFIIIYNLFSVIQAVKRSYRAVSDKAFRKREDLIPFSIPLAMMLLSNAGLTEVLATWLAVVLFGSFVFVVIGLNAAHHHPYIFHDGDAPPKDTDWGIFQMEAVIDRSDINGNHFLVMTNFGEHTLHHLFPTLDHEILPHLYGVFHQTCKDFNTFHRVTTQGHLVVGQFQQLSRIHTKGEEVRASYWRSLPK